MKFSHIVNGTIMPFVETIIPLLVGVAVVFFFISVLRYIYKAGDTGSRAAEKQAITWGLIALFVIVSIWGILAIFQNALFSGY